MVLNSQMIGLFSKHGLCSNVVKRNKLVTCFENRFSFKIGLVSRLRVFYCRVAGEKQIDVTCYYTYIGRQPIFLNSMK